MSNTIIQVTNLSKSYTISHEGRERYTALRDVMARKAKKIFSFPKALTSTSSTKEEFWALKDVSFEIEQGDRVGIIGRNGAGKSTLLKILSRITEPTTGSIKIKGRVASLLEVGTGFHPELTGRENIFLNGAILGMSRVEIRKHFDAIVDFAEIEKFLDTPVKRYSSGMYVRLAFAVAAHLEPEILIVDEVLAVGDAEFQKKCLGKMEDVSKNEGRTVLFVSHNIQAVRKLTNVSIFLAGGILNFLGKTNEAVELYVASSEKNNSLQNVEYVSGEHVTIHSIKFLNKEGNETNSYDINNLFLIELDFSTDGCKGLSIDLFLKDGVNFEKLALCSLVHFENTYLPEFPGRFVTRISLEKLNLAVGSYSIDIAIALIKVKWDIYIENAIKFEVSFCNPKNSNLWSLKQNFGYGQLAWLLSSPAKFIKL